MFKCDNCNISTLHYETMNRVVDKKRDVIYYHVYLTNKNTKKVIYKTYKAKDKDYYSEIDDLKVDGYFITKELETKGWEIEKELELCGKCKGEIK